MPLLFHSNRIKAFIVLLLCALVPVAAAFLGDGQLLIDEAIYRLMVHALATDGSLTVWNGYEEYPSPELVLTLTRLNDGTLVPQYPHLYAFAMLPFYWLFGYQGLFIANGLAYLGAVALVYLLARRLFDDRMLALNACLLFLLAGYSWEYSQAAWPHAVTLLAILGAVYLAVRAYDAETAPRAAWLAAAAGLVAGLGAGVRLDVVFVLPALLTPFLFARPWRPWPTLAACLGMLPGLALLAVVNHAKFGILSPFTYGTSGGRAVTGVEPYLPLALMALAIAVLGWLLTRSPFREAILRRPLPAAAALAVIAGGVLLVPGVWAGLTKALAGVFQLVVDFRVRDLAWHEGALSRGPTGGMIYLGSLKKSLLQSCPYLVAALLPLAAVLRGRLAFLPLAALFVAPLAYIAVYGSFAWHGGLGLNLRYLLPVLPFGAILAAYAWRQAAADLTPAWRQIIQGGAIALFFAFLLAFRPVDWSMALHEAVILTVPLLIAGAAAGLLLARSVASGRWAARLGGWPALALMLGFVWAGSVAFLYDLPRAAGWRYVGARMAEDVAPHVAEDSLLFVRYPDPFFGLLIEKRVRLALPDNDDMADLRTLADFHLDAGRNVYVWLGPDFRRTAEARHLFEGLTLTPLLEKGEVTLVRLDRRPQAALGTAD